MSIDRFSEYCDAQRCANDVLCYRPLCRRIVKRYIVDIEYQMIKAGALIPSPFRAEGFDSLENG